MPEQALIIEDDKDIAALITSSLRDLGYEVSHAADGLTGLDLATRNHFSLIILDLMLPGMHGKDVCRRIRKVDEEVVIVVVSMLSSEIDTVLLLELGADDYMTKPFRENEFKARIRTILRRSQRAKTEDLPQVMVSQDLEINFEKRTVTRCGKLIELTAREFDILSVMASAPGRPFTRDELIAEIYGQEVHGYDHSVTAHINRLRQKIEPQPDEPIYILTVRGFGYRFAEPKS
ncbi:MAG TPA: response regulator transcription factor [Oligoflexia bacterium]|nr:response regulator transcription factor [Oligoflexia bacterium]